MRCPNTPFATRLSGSAKETQLRICSIFQWKKKRPPVWLFTLIAVAIAACFGLVSCREHDELPSLALSDGGRVYAEIARLSDPAVDLIYESATGATQKLSQMPHDPAVLDWSTVELKEFHDVLGADGVVFSYHTYEDNRSKTYYAVDEQGYDILACTGQDIWEIDVDDDGQKELVTYFGKNRYLTLYQRIDGEVVETRVNDIAAASIGVDETVWMELFYYPDTGLVAAAWAKPKGETANHTFELAELFELAEKHWREENQPQPRLERAELTGLTLDADGAGDDAAYLESVIQNDWNSCTVKLQVVLGSGETLERQWDTHSYPHLSAARLTDPNRDCVIAALSDMGSTYGAETIYVLDVVDGRLVERLSFNGVGGSYVEGNTLRLAQLVNKWLSPEFYTAVWNGKEFDLIADGYLLNDHPLNWYGVDGEQGELTLRLRIPTEGDFFLGVDEVQLLRGEEITQVFTPADYGPFYANSYAAQMPLEFDDVNFDGYLDFGVLCDQSRDAKHHWFVWNQDECRFQFFGTLGGELSIDEHIWQITERLSDGVENHYSVSYTGKLIPLLHPSEEQSRFADQTKMFQSVLSLSTSILDATNGNLERKIIHTAGENTFTPRWFSVADLDRDSTPEVVLWMTLPGNSYAGFDILRYEEGKIVSYSQFYRGLNGLKQDGTFSFSSGASDHGFGRVEALDETGVQIEAITWCQSADNSFGVEFFVDGSASNRAGFDKAIASQDEKPDVVWYTFEDENIRLLGGLIAAAAG